MIERPFHLKSIASDEIQWLYDLQFAFSCFNISATGCTANSINSLWNIWYRRLPWGRKTRIVACHTILHECKISRRLLYIWALRTVMFRCAQTGDSTTRISVHPEWCKGRSTVLIWMERKLVHFPVVHVILWNKTMTHFSLWTFSSTHLSAKNIPSQVFYKETHL